MSDSPAYARILPPDRLRGTAFGFTRDEALEAEVRNEFLCRGGLFFDAEHGHLTAARVGVLWCASRHVVRGSEKVGTMELAPGYDAPVNTWGEAQKRDWLRGFFGQLDWPHFLMRLSAPLCRAQDDREFFATIDHECCHGSVATDQYGAPRFNDNTGLPVWKIRPHDYEGFAGTTERWGAAADGSEAIVRAALAKPRFNWIPGRDIDASSICGNK